MHAKRNFHPWRALAPVPCDGREFCTLLAVAAHTELWRFANHTVVSCLSSLQSYLSVCSMPQASLFASLSLVCLHHLQLLLPSCTQCTYASSAMFSCTLPSAVTGTRSLFWQNGQLLLVLCSPAFLVQKCLFMLPVGAMFSSFDDRGKFLLQYSIITFVPSNLVSDGLEV